MIRLQCVHLRVRSDGCGQIVHDDGQTRGRPGRNHPSTVSRPVCSYQQRVQSRHPVLGRSKYFLFPFRSTSKPYFTFSFSWNSFSCYSMNFFNLLSWYDDDQVRRIISFAVHSLLPSSCQTINKRIRKDWSGWSTLECLRFFLFVFVLLLLRGYSALYTSTRKRMT